ncbi:hypothetical protein OH77DRAFT_975509 [Trametes cingulata]|nr:hypothetical protein OH77DRAFT_975509 [Trametes cingulata]
MTAYNAEDGVRWERYADAFRTWLARQGPYPGDPPAGYMEVYKKNQRYAPCPQEFPDLVAAARQPAQDIPGVTMTAGAFSAFLAHASAVNTQIAGLVQTASPPPSQWHRRAVNTTLRYEHGGRGGHRRGRGRGRDRAHFQGGPLTERISAPSGAPRRDRSTRRGRRDGMSTIEVFLNDVVDALGRCIIADGYAVDEHAVAEGDEQDQPYEEGDHEASEQGPDPMAVDRQEPSGFENKAY